MQTIIQNRNALDLALRHTEFPVAFDLPSIGEIQFIEPVILAFIGLNPNTRFILVHREPDVEFLRSHLGAWSANAILVRNDVLRSFRCRGLRLFVTSEQYDCGLEGVYSVCLFHGQAGKGLSFVPEVISTFDAIFLLGPLHREAFDHYVNDFHAGIPPANPTLVEVGYPKSDRLVSGEFSKAATLRRLGFSADRPTVLYAPAFNEGASLREQGVEIVRELVTPGEFNVILKLPIDIDDGKLDNHYATGGVAWRDRLMNCIRGRDNVHLATERCADEYLNAADVLVTCISTISFEFFALDKPVVFVSSPGYFEDILPRRFPHLDTRSWRDRDTVNAGQRYGYTVDRANQLSDAIRHVLSTPTEFASLRSELRPRIYYNPGKSAEVAARQILDLIKSPRQSNRIPLPPAPVKHTTSRVKKVLRASTDHTRSIVKRMAKSMLLRRGYSIQRVAQAPTALTKGGYIDSATTVASAASAGMTICEYLESKENDPRKKGRRDRIIAWMQGLGALDKPTNVVEIGAGTGMYLERVQEICRPNSYEVYEIDRGWHEYLVTRFKNDGMHFRAHVRVDEELYETETGEADLVHAHGVFVYLPFLKSISYIRDAARCLRPGGFLVFDCYHRADFQHDVLKRWLNGSWRFPVILDADILQDVFEECGLSKVDVTPEIHANGTVTYYAVQKR